jgi:glycerol uptake facilitator protein
MYGPFFGEFMGTLVLILLGDGAVANVLLKKSKGENSGWIVITTAWGMAVVAGIFTAIAFGSPGAHINPAITLTVAVLSKDWSNVGLFWSAQILGGFTGACLVWLVYLPHWKVTPDAEAKLAVFCNTPAIRNLPANLMTEIIATTCLIVVGFSFGSPAVSTTGLPIGFGPWLWGVLVWAIGLGLGGPTGYAINPARDFGPRVAHAILPISDKGSSDYQASGYPVTAHFAVKTLVPPVFPCAPCGEDSDLSIHKRDRQAKTP